MRMYLVKVALMETNTNRKTISVLKELSFRRVQYLDFRIFDHFCAFGGFLWLNFRRVMAFRAHGKQERISSASQAQ